jgi:hypothetical protein
MNPGTIPGSRDVFYDGYFIINSHLHRGPFLVPVLKICECEKEKYCCVCFIRGYNNNESGDYSWSLFLKTCECERGKYYGVCLIGVKNNNNESGCHSWYLAFEYY